MICYDFGTQNYNSIFKIGKLCHSETHLNVVGPPLEGEQGGGPNDFTT